MVETAQWPTLSCHVLPNGSCLLLHSLFPDWSFCTFTGLLFTIHFYSCCRWRTSYGCGYGFCFLTCALQLTLTTELERHRFTFLPLIFLKEIGGGLDLLSHW